MDTLSPALTARWFATADAYHALRHHWRALVQSDRKHTLTATHHLLYLALLGKDWRKAFTPPTNAQKLANGAFTGWVLFRALDELHYRPDSAGLLAPFAPHVTREMLAAVVAMLPNPVPSHYAPADFTPGDFPIPAYTLPNADLAPAPEPLHAS